MANESAGVRRDGLHAGRAEIYTYEAPWMIYACNWSVRATKRRERGTAGELAGRLAEKGRGGGLGGLEGGGDAREGWWASEEGGDGET